jgi:hypothetical protein
VAQDSATGNPPARVRTVSEESNYLGDANLQSEGRGPQSDF